MSCACENKKMSSDRERIRTLAKKLAVVEQQTIAIIKNSDGTYDFCPVASIDGRKVVEYISIHTN